MDNLNNKKNPTALKPSVKTIYLDTSGNMSRKGTFLGILFLFICIFAVCAGLILCVSDSFNLELNMPNIMLTVFLSILFFTLIYFLPSKIFTVLAFLLGAGGLAYCIIPRLSYIIDAAYYSLNLCLYRINQEGYIIGSIVDYDLAEMTDEITVGYLNITAILIAVLLSAIFSYLVYSRKNIIYSVVISVAVVFPGFFYGLIPSYFAFSLVASFWVSQFAINMFEASHMAYVIGRENQLPEKRLAKYKLKMFKKQYKQNIKSIKSEIVNILKSPNRNENSIKLDKLVRQLKSISENERLFFAIHGLNKNENRQSARQRQNKKAGVKNSVKTKQSQNSKNKEKFLSPVKTEQLRLKTEAKDKKETAKLARQKNKKEFKQKPFSEKLKIRFKNNLNNKKKYSVRGGYAGFFAFVVAFIAVSAVQPFISPKAKFDISMPEKVLDFLTSTIEYTLVGSDSSVYGGYNGGMGGGFLYRPGGAQFKDKPILKIQPYGNSNYLNLSSGAVYLKGWTGTIYTGKMWIEADKKQIEEYNSIGKSTLIPGFDYVSEQTFFKAFTENMQDIFAVPHQRRSAELKNDKLKIEHLVSGGKRSFMPYFYESYESELFKFETNADLNIEITNSLFKYPIYTANFYSSDNVLNRSGIAIAGMREYLDYYYTRMETDADADIERFLSQVDPPLLLRTMPDISFISERDFLATSNRSLDRMIEAGRFYRYTAPSAEYSEMDEYKGFVYIPNEYEEIMDIARVRNNINNLGWIGNPESFIISDYIDSEVVYNKFVRKYYLGLPDNFPQEVKDLAEEITLGINTDYEKAVAIEQYLATNYTYTLNPMPPMDTKADFVYNFLIDVKEGYCTAYASSMVTMLRSIGIPARYTEGYLVDASQKQRGDDGKEYIIIYDYNGHAWPEVYIRGIGWIPFEPTVSYTETLEQEEAPYEYTPPRIPDYSNSYTPTIPLEEEEEILEEDEIQNSISPAFIVLIALILACGLIYIINLIVVSQRFKGFRNATPNKAVIKMLSYILGFLKQCGFVMHNEEGLISFAKRVAPNFATIKPDGWETIAGVMQKARYSKHKITEDERECVYEFIEILRKECLKKLKFDLRFKLRFVYFIL